MAGPDFHPHHPPEEEDASVIAHNTLRGLLLCGLYMVFYGGFMLLSAFWPEVMSREVLGGANLAVTYGFALIALALILALIYLKVCLHSK